MEAETVDLTKLTPGRRVAVRRVILGITQGQIAELLGEHRPRISELEHDRADGQKGARLLTEVGEILNRLEAAT